MFCPSCGNNTLKRVSVSVDEKGTLMAFFNPKRKISTRGTRYTIPKPQGGRGPKVGVPRVAPVFTGVLRQFITDEAQLPKVRHEPKKAAATEYAFGDARSRHARARVCGGVSST